jgi:hypothetical protein
MKGGGCTTTWCSTETLDIVASQLANSIIRQRDVNGDSDMPTDKEVMEIAIQQCSGDPPQGEPRGDNYSLCFGRLASDQRQFSNKYSDNFLPVYSFHRQLYRHKLTDVVSKAMPILATHYAVPKEIRQQKKQTDESEKQKRYGEIEETKRKQLYSRYVDRVLEQKKQSCVAEIDSQKQSYLDDPDLYSKWLATQPKTAGRRKYAKRRTRKYR